MVGVEGHAIVVSKIGFPELLELDGVKLLLMMMWGADDVDIEEPPVDAPVLVSGFIVVCGTIVWPSVWLKAKQSYSVNIV